MSAPCPIFAAALFMEKVWHEAELLQAAVVNGLARRDLVATFDEENCHHDDWAGQRTAYSYSLVRAFRYQKSPAQLVLHFDLARPSAPSGWRPGSRAMLVVAYESRLADGWEVEQLLFDESGRFVDDDVRANLVQADGLGGKLLTWRQPAQVGLARTPWLFGVELARLSNPEEVEHLVVESVHALLRGTDDLAKFMTDRELVVWPKSPPAAAYI